MTRTEMNAVCRRHGLNLGDGTLLTEEVAKVILGLKDNLENCEAALKYFRDGDAAKDLAEATKQLRQQDTEMVAMKSTAGVIVELTRTQARRLRGCGRRSQIR